MMDSCWSISELEASMVVKKESALQVNHEQTSSTQQLIAAHVDALVTVVEEMGSTFEKDGQDLLSLQGKGWSSIKHLWMSSLGKVPSQ